MCLYSRQQTKSHELVIDFLADLCIKNLNRPSSLCQNITTQPHTLRFKSW